ncbi:prephenate dehydrogenase [Nocardioides conyzicola]|uniref:Prephenate dehydrogenase/arogenate dehydrogenase family protein n=1 Tax=Nocardioides conyzicola TaxID=1651781 RepID=A0ABP8WYG7_9ACTN
MADRQRVAVLGLGLIGGSIALRLAAAGLDVEGYDPDPTTRSLAAEARLEVHDELGEWLAGADVVVLAVPLDVMEPSLGTIAAYARPDALVWDVGSVKEPVHELAAGAGLADRFVGCHPMAGSELSGFGATGADLLVGVTWAVTAVEATPAAAVRDVIGFLSTHFDAHVAVLRPTVHDRVVASVSHLPHVLANELLTDLGASDHPWTAAAMAAGSFRDGTRVGGHNSARTANMVADNRRAVAASLAAAIERLTELQSLLDAADKPDLEAWFAASENVRDTYLVDAPQTSTLPVDATNEVLVEHGEDGWLVVGTDADGYRLQRGALNRVF